ncbi:MAG: DUF3794 domain-containing protein [Clostridiales bacterium]|nr:DUF3794 domain-containing protein [Clostridiales bacterium]
MEQTSFEISRVKPLTRYVWQFNLSKDINVPDYMSDIKEILLDNARVKITEEKFNGDRIYVSGLASYELLLSDEEQQGAVNSLSGDINFNEVIKTNGSSEGEFTITCEVNEKKITMVHPRKINISLVITLTASGAETVTIPVITSMSGDDRIICREEKDTLSTLIYKGFDETLILEDFAPDDTQSEIDEICYTDYSIRDTYTISHDDGFSMCMTLILFVIYQNTEGGIEAFSKSLNIKAFVGCTGTTGQTIYAKPYVNGITVSKKEDSENMRAVCSLSLKLTVYSEIYSQITTELLKDAYTCSGSLFLERPSEMLYMPKLTKEDFTVCESIAPAGDVSGNPLFACLSVKDISKTLEDGRLCVNSSFEVTAYYRGEEKPFTHVTRVFENKTCIALSEDKNINPADILSSITLRDINLTVSDNEITAKLELSILILTKKMYEGDFISGASFEEGSVCNKKHITCYFVKEGDTLFSIGKKYKVTPKELEAGNPDLSLKPGSTLYMYTSGGDN